MSDSDYTKNNTNFYDLLPEVYRNDYTKSLFNNLFNRYVTKDELVHTDGYIGSGNPNAIIDRNIKEHTPNRQAFQLQPMLYSKIGTVEHMATWKDILNEMDKVGIDTSTLKEWIHPQKFNFVPPLDISKLLHFSDYYWYNPENPSDRPQYLTIKNLCNVVEAKVQLYTNIINNNGAHFTIIDIDEINNTFTLNSDLASIFSLDSTIYTKNSTLNSSINEVFWSVSGSIYDSLTDTTIISVNENITDGTPSGIISLDEFLEILNNERDCICNGAIGFDKSQFDDNQLGNILWNTDLLTSTSYPTLNDWVTAGNDLTSYDLWYDTTSDSLKQFSLELSISNGTTYTDENNWIIIRGNLSVILNKTEGQHFFDLTLGCTYPRNQWIDQNKWVHKSVIPNFSIAKQAEIPIIEFMPYLELNEWTHNHHSWLYRENKFTPFVEVDDNPELLELVKIDTYKLEPGFISLDSKYGDLSNTFTSDYKFNILNSVGALYPIINLSTGLGGTFTVVGNITNDYTTINDLVNLQELPSIFKIRNSPSGLLDLDWTIDNIDIISSPGNSIITVIPTQSINTFSFAGSEIFQTNNGSYNVEYSTYEKVISEYPIVNINFNTNQLTILGDISLDTDFSGYFYTDKGVFEYSNIVFNGTNTVLTIKEQLHATFNSTTIFIDEFKTRIKISETLYLYSSISSSLVPIKTSKGHVWTSYDTHWVYDGIKEVTPINKQNLLPGLSLDVPLQIVDDQYSLIHSSNDFEYKVNRFVQSFFITKVGGISKFEIHKALHDIAAEDTNNIRVYVKTLTDNRFIRQYGNYDELTNSGYVTGIEFNSLTPIEQYAEIKIEVGPATISDIGYEFVSVRTEVDDNLYDINPVNYTNTVDLREFDKNEQVKTDINQYPLFDIYDTSGNSLNLVSEIFKFKEDSNVNINFNINKRIVKDGQDFTFEQGLINEVDDSLYVYRDNKQSHLNYFVNSVTNEVFIWNNFTWNSRILTSSHYLYPIVSDMEPTGINNTIEGQIWYNHILNELKVYDGISFIGVAFEYATIDPTLKTIWQPGLYDESYEPKYVNDKKVEVSIGDELGDWEIPDPLYYNVHHENRKEISLLYLTSHFNTIINSQLPIPGFGDAANNTFHINSNPNYGLGGTIREYNDGFDILLSSMFLNTITTKKLLDFAQNQYSSSLISLTESLVKNLKDDLLNDSISNVDELYNYIISETITRYEFNDINNFIYVDSPSYDGTNGIKNWIATLPMLGLSDKIEPYLMDEKQFLIRHHDGHLSSNALVPNTKEHIITQVLNTDDERVDAGIKIGNTRFQYTIGLPTTESEVLTKFNSTVLINGKYWYDKQNNVNTFYRLNLKHISSITPVPVGLENDKWYNNTTSTLYKLISNTWTIVTSFGDGIISEAWEIIDLDSLNSNLILTVEHKLYDTLPDIISQKLDHSVIETNTQYNSVAHETFNEYIKGTENTNPLSQLGIYNTSNPYTWNYIKSDLSISPYVGSPSGTNIGGCWQDLYEKVYGTAYPNREPWVLQGYNFKPNWWDSEYKDLTGNRVWIYNHSTTTGMWNNILNGIVPVGYILPDLSVSTGTPSEVTVYDYLSVMIDDSPIGLLLPDDLLPPYWDHKPVYGIGYVGPVRTMFNDFSLDIKQPNLDYKFGDKGTNEWIWNHSIEYKYDLMKIFYRIDPLKFYHDSFGIEYNIINDLQIDRASKKVYSHVDSTFHGELYDNNTIFEIFGINQWFTNYNRYFGIDPYTSTFKGLWNDWTTPLTYQFGSFIDTDSFDIQNKNFDIVNSDLSVTMKKSLGIKESWIDALNILVLKVPNPKLGYNTSHKWSFNISTNTVRDIEYYDVKKYPIHVDNDICTLYKFDILSLDSDNNTITIAGNWAHIFGEFEILESINNDNNYTIDSVLFDSSLNLTIIKPIEPINDTIVDGTILSKYRTIDWETGQEVKFESSELLPRPFIDTDTYYIIRINDTQFKLAADRVDAVAGIPIEFDVAGTGELFVGEIIKTFNAISNINSSESWADYAIDKNNILSFNLNKIIYGIQECIDIVKGYESYMLDDGWLFNNDNIEIDQSLGRTISWQLELEKFINQLFIIQKDKQTINDTYDFQGSNNILEFSNFNSAWSTGTKVLLNSIGSLPSPLYKNTPYYIIRDTNNKTFNLAQTLSNANNNIPISILSNGDISKIEKYNPNHNFYTFELNPFKNNIWYNNKQGIISDIVSGPYKDLNIDNTIYDQDLNTLYTDKVSIYREDSIAKILLNDPIIDINKQHISGFHLFVDGYEHVIFFENYSAEGFLIYDPYIGLNTGRFDLIFDKQTQFTLRPNIGGKFLTNKTEFISNIESLTKNLESAYSTYSTSESNQMTKLARLGLGYNKTEQTFLDKLEINDKSQFIFWKGLIQYKGSINAMNAFINSRRFVDAKLDEYWAYNIGTFGDAKRKIYPELKIRISDTLSNELKLEFIKENELPENNFVPVSISDEDLWFEYSDQKESLLQNFGAQHYFNAEITNTYPNNNAKLIVNTFNSTGVQIDIDNALWFTSGIYYFKTLEPFDSVLIQYIDNQGIIQNLLENTDFLIINSRIIKFTSDPRLLDQLKINTLNLATSKHNPMKIIDYKSDIKLLDLPLWNPAKGHQYHLSKHLIDLTRSSDPAEYSNVLDPILFGNELDAWKSEHNNTVWLDDSLQDYYPYYDQKIETSTIGRIRNWAKTSDYANTEIYQWTESNLTPTEWDNVAIIEEIDKTIPDSIRKSGRARSCTFNTGTNKYEKTYKWYEEYSILDEKYVHDIDSIIFNGIEPEQVTEYIDNIKLKYNIKGYINGIYNKDVEILPEYGKRVIDFGGNVVGLNLVGLVSNTYYISINESNVSFVDISIVISGTETWDQLVVLINNELSDSFVSIIDNNLTFELNNISNISLLQIEPVDTGDLFSNISSFVDIDNTTNINVSYQFDPLSDSALKTIIWFEYIPTEQDIDSGGYIIDYPHTKVVIEAEDGSDSITYYYWVKNKTTKINKLLSLIEIKNDMLNIPIPYAIIQNYLNADNDLPNRYNQLVIKGLSDKIDDNDRYKLKFTHDFTLRDDIDDSSSNLSLKNIHNEWKLFREKQPYHIDRYLWNKVIESVLGKTIINNKRVPSLDRELYDIENDTETKYGINTGQIFLDRELVIDVIYKDLFNPNNDFYPVDIDSFIQNNNFDTPSSSLSFLEDLYNKFASEHLNRIFFSILHIAFSKKLQYKDIIKTSNISLHGIRILETNGIYDD